MKRLKRKTIESRTAELQTLKALLPPSKKRSCQEEAQLLTEADDDERTITIVWDVESDDDESNSNTDQAPSWVAMKYVDTLNLMLFGFNCVNIPMSNSAVEASAVRAGRDHVYSINSKGAGALGLTVAFWIECKWQGFGSNGFWGKGCDIVFGPCRVLGFVL